MNTAGKLSAYGLALAVLAAGGWAFGAVVGPVNSAAGKPDEHGNQHTGQRDNHSGTVAETHRHDAQQPEDPAGLASSRNGYTLAATDTTLAAGETNQLSFRIIGPDGEPVTRFGVEHEKRLHLIVIRRDASGYQHLHPEMRSDGTWTVPLALDDPGSYRAFVDFVPAGGEPATLGIDLAVPGDFQPAAHQQSRVAEVDGYRVRLDGELVPGQGSELTLTVDKDGKKVTDLQPYLGAYGHLVALREGDLGYLHVHPDGEPGDGRTKPGPTIGFHAEVPSAGTYRLFVDFRHEGKVRTAAFTVSSEATEAGEKGKGDQGAAEKDHDSDGHTEGRNEEDQHG